MTFRLIGADVMEGMRALPDQSVNCCVTSPPYFGLRDYGCEGQIGLEPTPEEYTERLVNVFREVRRVLRDDGTLWLNLGDSYAATGKSGGGKQGERWIEAGASATKGKGTWQPAPDGYKPKDLMGMPWRVAFALQSDGWYLRSDIIWAKPNPMPESVTDRCTKAHEYLFLLSKSQRYYYDHESIKEPATDTGRENGREGRIEDPAARPPGSNPRTLKRIDYSQVGRNKRSVWTIPTQGYPEAHFAVMPEDLVEPCVLAGCQEGGTVLDPFTGSGTVGVVALRNGRNFVGIELNPQYVELATQRIYNDAPLLNEQVA